MLASFWLQGAAPGSPWHPKGRFRDLFLSTCFSYRFLVDFGCPSGSQGEDGSIMDRLGGNLPGTVFLLFLDENGVPVQAGAHFPEV